jgi:hypothetical protein
MCDMIMIGTCEQESAYEAHSDLIAKPFLRKYLNQRISKVCKSARVHYVQLKSKGQRSKFFSLFTFFILELERFMRTRLSKSITGAMAYAHDIS